MKYKVIKELYDPFTSKLKSVGDIIEIDVDDERLYGGRIEKVLEKNTSKKAVK